MCAPLSSDGKQTSLYFILIWRFIFFKTNLFRHRWTNIFKILPNLELRRLHLDLIFCYKVVFGLVGVNIDDFFQFNHAANTRGHAYKLFKSRSVNNIRKNFFAERIVNVWNGLPPFVSFASLSTFRRTIQKVDFSQFMKCTWLFKFTVF